MTETKKPPIGLVPRKVWLWERADDITRALDRYNCEEKLPPDEWLEELRNIYRQLDHQRIINTPTFLDGANFNLFPDLHNIVVMDPQEEQDCFMCGEKYKPEGQEIICSDCFDNEMEKD